MEFRRGNSRVLYFIINFILLIFYGCKKEKENKGDISIEFLLTEDEFEKDIYQEEEIFLKTDILHDFEILFDEIEVFENGADGVVLPDVTENIEILKPSDADGDGIDDKIDNCSLGLIDEGDVCFLELPQMWFEPLNPSAGNDVIVHIKDKEPWVYVDVLADGPCGEKKGEFKNVNEVAEKVWQWNFVLYSLTGGNYLVKFTANNGAKTIITKQLFVSGETTCKEPSGDIVKVSNGKFFLDNKEFKFVGMNIRGLVHYGKGDILPYSKTEDIKINLQAMKNMGAKVARVFLANKFISHNECASRLKDVLDIANFYEIKLIIAFTDFYNTGFNPKGDDKFYKIDNLGYDVLSNDFFQSGYKENYLPFIQTVVPPVKKHPAIFSWELGNEIKNVPDPEAFINFAKEVSNTIRSIDEDHLITGGIISIQSNAFSWDQGIKFYSLPNINFLTTHNYSGGGDNNVDVAKAVNKPLIIEEAGFKMEDGDRAKLIENDLNKWFNKGAKGYMQWGFMATLYDNGDGDKAFGMDYVFHPDWNALFNVYKNFAGKIN